MRTEGEVRDALKYTEAAWKQPNRVAPDQWLTGVQTALRWFLGEVGDIDLTHGEAVPAKEVP